MAIAIRYVDKRGNVIERFLGIEHVPNTNALTLKEAMESLFSRLGLSSSRLRGQGYDGASNMQALVAVAKNHEQINMLFYFVNRVVVIVSASCKRRDILRDNRILEVMKSLDIGELSSGKSLNQETNLIRAGDTRWGSHYGTLVRLVNMFSSVIEVLEFVSEDHSNTEQKAESNVLLENLQSFEFVFNLHLMRVILAITSELSLALQRKDQDIVNAMALVNMSKNRLRMMRNTGWESLLDDVNSFCEKKEIHIPNMDDKFVARGRGRRNASQMTNLHHYRVELFNTVLDLQLSELNSRFSEAATELLLCVACLNPCNSFSSFDKKKLIRLAELYPNEFSRVELMVLPDQLDTYIFDMRTSNEFSSLNGIAHLSRKMVETGRDKVHPFVYLLLTLALILPVATATFERSKLCRSLLSLSTSNQLSPSLLRSSKLLLLHQTSMAARNTIVEVAVPTTDQWKRAPYVQTVGDPFWALVEAYPAKGAPVANPTFFTAPTDLGHAELVNPSSILHLRIERGDLPYTKCHFGPQASPPIDWAEWVDEIVYDVPRKQILMGSGTYNAVMLSQSLGIPWQGAAIKNLEHACSRWSVNTHTFAWAWGESGLSLEDMVILTRLSLCSASILDLVHLSRED
ncbi:hypothetical protein RHMOL_Rhmol10G0210100 [Rhododendron molle]|uniref:Uncharacterized protein n=1 Tax=Rhododendron molle TaxID=49168 RepID=A0ACC0M5Q5_RHOML|nr:hypothetical protein RHMOL_Rhmol10G0210100 [Rhododendron molle]